MADVAGGERGEGEQRFPPGQPWPAFSQQRGEMPGWVRHRGEQVLGGHDQPPMHRVAGQQLAHVAEELLLQPPRRATADPGQKPCRDTDRGNASSRSRARPTGR
jgi:hypothetical protein